MADITKCINDECIFKAECKRYTIAGSDYQSTHKFQPNKYGCNFYLKDNSVKKVKSSILKSI